ncbi:MAG: hypothetical protein M1826_006619 [Phylliscum demangeonii]|nr:MAG: hypothetical protein M1826_006619 [Phylliscum demangeonii]
MRTSTIGLLALSIAAISVFAAPVDHYGDYAPRWNGQRIDRGFYPDSQIPLEKKNEIWGPYEETIEELVDAALNKGPKQELADRIHKATAKSEFSAGGPQKSLFSGFNGKNVHSWYNSLSRSFGRLAHHPLSYSGAGWLGRAKSGASLERVPALMSHY